MLKVPNPISAARRKRYETLSDSAKQALEALDKKKPSAYQLRRLKKSKERPSEGDIFVLSPREGVFFFGKVLQVRIHHLTGDTFIHDKSVAFIFKYKSKKIDLNGFVPEYTNILLGPIIVDDSYWKQGLCQTIGNQPLTDAEQNLDYGFYDIDIKDGHFCLANGEILDRQPGLISIYGITTISGVASQIEREFICYPELLQFS